MHKTTSCGIEIKCASLAGMRASRSSFMLLPKHINLVRDLGTVFETAFPRLIFANIAIANTEMMVILSPMHSSVCCPGHPPERAAAIVRSYTAAWMTEYSW